MTSTAQDELTERLLDAAIIEIAAHGPHAANVAAIARRAGLTTGAIYPRWLNKAELLTAAEAHARVRLGDIDADKLEAMVGLIGATADAMYDPRAARAYIRLASA